MDTKAIISLISSSEELQDMWTKYQKKFVYAQDVSYEQIMEVLKWLMQNC